MRVRGSVGQGCKQARSANQCRNTYMCRNTQKYTCSKSVQGSQSSRFFPGCSSDKSLTRKEGATNLDNDLNHVKVWRSQSSFLHQISKQAKLKLKRTRPLKALLTHPPSDPLTFVFLKMIVGLHVCFFLLLFEIMETK